MYTKYSLFALQHSIAPLPTMLSLLATPFIASFPGLIPGPLTFPPSAGLGAWGRALGVYRW